VPGIELSPEQRRGAIAAIQRYFENERAESIGELAALLLLDFFAEEIGEVFYNRGVDDAQALLRRQWTALDDELEVIKMPERRPSDPGDEGEAEEE
jgi:uncharacterized protein (DUF2164 family)